MGVLVRVLETVWLDRRYRPGEQAVMADQELYKYKKVGSSEKAMEKIIDESGKEAWVEKTCKAVKLLKKDVFCDRDHAVPTTLKNGDEKVLMPGVKVVKDEKIKQPPKVKAGESVADQEVL